MFGAMTDTNKIIVIVVYATKIGRFLPNLSANCPAINDPIVKKIKIKHVLMVLAKSLIFH